jgi:hypothetical protein
MDGRTKIELDLNEEEIRAYSGKVKVGHMEFLIDSTQIIIVDLTIVNDKQSQGYGCLMINTLKGVAQFFKKPIYLISYPEKVTYYEKMEFFSLSNLYQDGLGEWSYKGKIVHIKNLNPEKPRFNQVGKVDMLWIPSILDEVDVFL